MSRSVFVVPFLALALQVSLAQTFSRGAPASVVSPTGTAACTEFQPACFHPHHCLSACILNARFVSMGRSAGLEIPDRTVRCFCRYRFSIRTTLTKATLRLPIHPSPIHLLLQLIQRLHSRPRMTEVTTNCVPPTCKALAMR